MHTTKGNGADNALGQIVKLLEGLASSDTTTWHDDSTGSSTP
ncbi:MULTISPECIES: hypothetical protein [Gordonia]|jgi:hypothetical protein|nr:MULTISPECIES: hypothetical protein [Gordonia]